MFLYIIAAVIVVNFIASLIFFIIDAVRAKRANRVKSAGIIAWFIASLTILILAVLSVVLLIALVNAFMASM